MPHVIVEYAPTAEQAHDLQTLCDRLFTVLADHPAIPDARALKIRVLPVSAWRIGTPGQSFAHATLMLLPGRHVETKNTLSKTVLDELQLVLPDVASLSVDVVDLGPAYTKRVL